MRVSFPPGKFKTTPFRPIVSRTDYARFRTPFAPTIIEDSSVFIISTRQAWLLTELEVSDGFYHPICFILRIAMDQFAVSVLVSFVVVGLTTAIYWPYLLDGEDSPFSCTSRIDPVDLLIPYFFRFF